MTSKGIRYLAAGLLLLAWGAAVTGCTREDQWAGSANDQPVVTPPDNSNNNPPPPSHTPGDHDFGNNYQELYLAVGDSITEGNEHPVIVPYPERLGAMLGKPVVNEAVGGAHSGAGAADIGDLLESYTPGYLLILFGVNDIHPGYDPAETIANLAAIIHAAKANKTIPVIATLTPVFGRSDIEPYLPDLNDRIRELAAMEDITLVDLDQMFGWLPQYILPDGVHPNELGTALMALSFYEALQ